MIDFRKWPAIALVRSYFTLLETRATLSTNQITLIKTTHNYVTLVFPRFWTFAWFFLWILIGSLFTFTLIGRCEVNRKEFAVWENKLYHEGDKIFFLLALCAFSLIFSFRSSICCSKEPITSSLQRKKKKRKMNVILYYTLYRIQYFPLFPNHYANFIFQTRAKCVRSNWKKRRAVFGGLPKDWKFNNKTM